jgi:hypothetical protein
MDSLQMEYVSAIILAMIAGPIGAQGNPEQAVRFLAASEKQLKIMGASLQPADIFEVDQVKKEFREQLSEIEFKKAWDEGHRMTIEQAIAMAIKEGT